MLRESILIFFCALAVSSRAADPDSWLRVPTCKSITNSDLCVQLGSKFYLINGRDRLNWFEAQRFCRRNNANLVTIENFREWNLVANYLGSKGYKVDWHRGGQGFWTSGYDLGSQPGVFHSVATGNYLPFTAWSHGQPDNAGGNEHCAHIWYKDNFGMNDYQCNQAQNYICEFKERVQDEAPKTAVCET